VSQRNVEVVQRFFEAVERLLDGWETSRSLVDTMKAGDLSPDAREARDHLSPEAEWRPAFSGETYRGPLEIGRGWDELLEAAEAPGCRVEAAKPSAPLVCGSAFRRA
jgi:hypothetical protein